MNRWGYDEPTEYVQLEHFPGVIVAYSLSRTPVLLRPEHVHPAPATFDPAALTLDDEDEAQGAMAEALTDVIAVAELPDEEVPAGMLESLRAIGWDLTRRPPRDV